MRPLAGLAAYPMALCVVRSERNPPPAPRAFISALKMEYCGSVLDTVRDRTHSQHMTTIRTASSADAARLSRLAATTFRDTFETENAPEDMERYLAEAFTPEQQAAEIADPDSTILVAENPSSDNAELVGYATWPQNQRPRRSWDRRRLS